MTGTAIDALTILKEYGLAGVLAWLFWWTLRRMMTSHDATVSRLKEQLAEESASFQAATQRFSQVVENHVSHASNALSRFEICLTQHTDEQRRWQDRLLATLERMDSYFRREARA
jgi:FtsZ-binding cell division protein ZapB